MSLFHQGNQFDDDETNAALAGNRFAAASRMAALGGFGSTSAQLARAAAERSNAGASSYLSLLAGDNSPYANYQRQAAFAAARPAYLTQQMQSPYSALSAAAVSSPGLAYARAGSYAYQAASPQTAVSGFPAGYGSPHRDFQAYYGQQARDVPNATPTERSYQTEENTKKKRGPKKTPATPATPKTLQQYIQDQQKAIKSPSEVSSSPKMSPPSRGGRGAGRSGRGGRGGRGNSRGGRGKKTTKPSAEKKSKTPEKDEGPTWFSGCIPLGLPDDKYWLSELQVYLRSNFAEAFGATEADIAAPMHGRNKPIALGQVGIRCMHCRDDPPSERGQQATSYPSLISGIYNSVQQMLRLHFDCCLSMPPHVRKRIEQLKLSSSSRGGRKQYWIDSAKRLGLADTPHGIHFARDPYGPLPPLSETEREEELKRQEGEMETPSSKSTAKEEEVDEPEEEEEPEDTGPPVPQVEPYPLVLPEDQDLISDYLYLTLEQMAPCNLIEADKVGCYKGRKVGFPGLACMHCVGQAGCGRYFPASEASLSQTTTSQTIMNHVRNCRRCPVEIRENLELMKRARMGPDGKRADKPKHGGRKVFFHRLWCRIQRIPLTDDEGRRKGKRKKDGNPKKATKKRRVSSSKGDDSDVDHDDNDDIDSEVTSEETETEEEGQSSDDQRQTDDYGRSEKRVASLKATMSYGKRKAVDICYDGCVRLTKADDPHWLSEMQCFVRSDMIEMFSYNKKKDSLDGYGGRKVPDVGQVGIRCVFCKALPKAERAQGCIYFPDSLASIHTNVGDMIRLHFPCCPAMPDEVKSTFRSVRGFGAKADGDAQQYWIDAARDIGLGDVPPYGQGWGITFRRDPLQPSPADELDRENAGATTFHFGKSSLLRSDDRGMCTDHAMLLLRQVKPCRFKKSDRRGGPGSRGRDRVIGFPGVCCKHCSSKNSFGRYFPVSAKNLTDNTANSLQSHVQSCSRCPEPIRASLAYLTHRSTLQKAELSGSWKKSFYKRIWERLHVERSWSKTEDAEENEDVGSDLSVDENIILGDEKTENASNSDSDEEDLGEDMADLIKAAAVWLSEQEGNVDSSRSRGVRGRSIPAKRPLPLSMSPRGRGLPSSKKKKVSE